jgi:MGT family glycosyltransferase
MAPIGSPLGATRDRLLNGIATCVLRSGVPALNKARAEQGLPPLREWAEQLLGVREICVLTAPELDYSSHGALPPNVRYVGPAFEPYPHEWTSPWPDTNTDPLVVISLSTSYMNQQALAQRILDAIAGLPVRGLLTAGPALETDQLQIPANARTVAYIPHRSVFPHATLAITHAGWQTINAALADGVPLLCIPDGRDQPDNAARVIACGAGVRAHKSTPPAKLRRVIADALQNSEIKRGASAIAQALARSDGGLTTAEIVEHLARPDAATSPFSCAAGG